MYALAVNGNCVKVERNGAVGYALKSCLAEVSDTPSDDSTAKEETTDKKEETTDKDKKEETTDKKEETSSSGSSSIFNSGYSNEQITYLFLTRVMGYNTAAAVGVMSNIKHESGYKPVSNGDSGTSYGICQWHAGRKTNLINWCTENGLDYNTVEGQLRFLQYELPTRYPSVDSYIRQVENTADGAYDAAYYFCFNFEAPANRTAQSTKRGNYARDTLFPKK